MEFDKIKNIISEVLSIDADGITEETTFVDDLGADSLDIFQIIMAIEEEFEIEIWEIGEWKYYDESGNLIKTKDYGDRRTPQEEEINLLMDNGLKKIKL